MLVIISLCLQTTLLNHILTSTHGQRLAVIQNEFGAIAIDEDLVASSLKAEDGIFVANNGCICCTVSSDLTKILGQLQEMHNEKPIDGVVLETTGLARPAPIVQTFITDRTAAQFANVDSILTVVDAKNILNSIGAETDTEEREQVAEQIAFADVLLLNKTDLVDDSELQKVQDIIKTLNPWVSKLVLYVSLLHVCVLLLSSTHTLQTTHAFTYTYQTHTGTNSQKRA